MSCISRKEHDLAEKVTSALLATGEKPSYVGLWIRGL